MTGKIWDDPDKPSLDGTEKVALVTEADNYGSLLSTIAAWLAGLAQTLTNKTIDAASNTVSNITTAMFEANAVDTDATLAANSDTRLASQKAVKTYIGNRRLDQAALPTADVSLNSHKLTNVTDPTGAQDAATKNYVDTVAQGLDTKPSVKAATTANITLSGTQTVDGVALVVADRCLVKNQSTASQNGIYVVASGSWTRATDADAWTELPGAYVFVEQGTVNADTGWVCTVDQGGTLGSTSVTFSQFSGVGAYVAGPGSSTSGNIATFNGTTGRTIQDSGVAFSTDGTFASNSDAKAPTEKAVKTYADARAVIGKNYLFNPSGELAQRGVTSAADATYDFDRWLTLTQSNPVTPSSVSDAENATPFMMRSLQANASAQRFGRIQWIEKALCRDLRGQAVSLSARVRMSASTTLRYAVVEWTGTADTITKDIVNDWTSGTFTTGNFFTSTTTTVVGTGSIALTANTFADISAAALGTVSGSMNNLAVFFWTDSTQAQNVTLDIAKVKLEKGSLCTGFVSPDMAAVVAACQRYYEKSYNLSVAPATASVPAGLNAICVNSNTIVNGQSMGSREFQVRKMKAPTVTVYGYQGGSGKVSDATPTDLAASSGSTGLVGERSFNVTNGSGGSITTTNNVVVFHFAADAEL